MKTLAMVLIAVGGGIFVADFASTALGNPAIFLGPTGYLATVQNSSPVPVDVALLVVGGGLYWYAKR